MTEQSIAMNGNISIDTFKVEGNEDSKFNANIHTNGSLSVKGNAALIRGFGTFVTGTAPSRSNLFQPYYNPGGAATVRQVPRIDIPVVTPLTVVSSNGGADRTTIGNQVLSGTYDFRQTVGGVSVGTRDNPYVWYIAGDATVSSTATFHGYVIFAVSGDISLGGNAIAGQAEGPTESKVAWYAGHDLDLRGNSQIWGQMMANGTVSFGGTPRIYGSITANAASLSGTPKVYFMRPSPALARTWQQPRTVVKLISYAESPVLN